MQLAEIRKQIDETDDGIIELLRRRAQLAIEVGHIKRGKGAPIYDPAREAALFRRLTDRPLSPLSAETIRAIYAEIVSACRGLEAVPKVAYLGPEHTFTHQAALRQFGAKCDYIPCRSFNEVFDVVERKGANFGVVAIENSMSGVIPETLDRFAGTELQICADLYLPVRHFLLSKVNLDEIETLHSKPEPFAQCRIWLREHLPNAQIVHEPSTTAAAQAAAERPNAAAIASEAAARAYGLKIIADNIQDTVSNRTRFFVIGSDPAAPTGRDKTSALFATRHKSGALHDALMPFHTHGINLTLIQSRPMHGRLWEYVFFVDFEGHVSDEHVAAAIVDLREACSLVKVLGSYPAAE